MSKRATALTADYVAAGAVDCRLWLVMGLSRLQRLLVDELGKAMEACDMPRGNFPYVLADGLITAGHPRPQRRHIVFPGASRWWRRGDGGGGVARPRVAHDHVLTCFPRSHLRSLPPSPSPGLAPSDQHGARFHSTPGTPVAARCSCVLLHPQSTLNSSLNNAGAASSLVPRPSAASAQARFPHSLFCFAVAASCLGFPIGPHGIWHDEVRGAVSTAAPGISDAGYRSVRPCAH